MKENMSHLYNSSLPLLKTKISSLDSLAIHIIKVTILVYVIMIMKECIFILSVWSVCLLVFTFVSIFFNYL